MSDSPSWRPAPSTRSAAAAAALAAAAANLQPSGSDDSSNSAEVSALRETVLRLQQAQHETELLDRDATRAHELQLIQAQRDLEQDRRQAL